MITQSKMNEIFIDDKGNRKKIVIKYYAHTNSFNFSHIGDGICRKPQCFLTPSKKDIPIIRLHDLLCEVITKCKKNKLYVINEEMEIVPITSVPGLNYIDEGFLAFKKLQESYGFNSVPPFAHIVIRDIDSKAEETIGFLPLDSSDQLIKIQEVVVD